LPEILRRSIIRIEKMAKLTRFGVSMDEELLSQFDELIRQLGYGNRSEALRDLVRERLVQREWEAGEEVVGVIVLLYDHHKRELTDRLTELQHGYHDLIAATMHIHLDEDNCLEILAVRGAGAQIQHLADRLIGLKGVKHGKLVATSTGRHLR
jgi:CopG family nickel-responsive transcriptional regulator